MHHQDRHLLLLLFFFLQSTGLYIFKIIFKILSLLLPRSLPTPLVQIFCAHAFPLFLFTNNDTPVLLY